MKEEEAVKKYLHQYNYGAINLKAVLIDMDGVLYDSMKNHANAWYQTIRDEGIDCELKEFYQYEGRTGASTINLLFNRAFGRDATPEEIARIYERKVYYFNKQPKAEIMPGAAQFLKKIKNAGLIPVLVTGSGQASLLDKLNHHYPDIFTPHHMVTAFDVKYGKPHPEPYLMGLKKAGVEAHEAITIENAPLGVESAVAAGIFTIAVNTGPLEDKVLLDAGANYLLPSMEALSESFEIIYQILNTTYTPV